ncbi:MAG: methyltransferase domain-containing protein [Cyanobacteria bacterium SID2]|nr:methyltransferase domain-containing protein [Cyanobacteria bacterium SID2]MBP0006706.1 methyltransferase domain-containing protein [Cyanobacteria bacterium SBC]
MSQRSETVDRAREYYDSENMLNFHDLIYGEHIHIGIYQTGCESISEANLQTLETIEGLLKLHPEHKLVDLGSGYGGAARYIVKRAGCHVDCLNLSTAQNKINRQLNQAQGLDTFIQVFDGSFQNIPFPDRTYDIALSQDALLYSDDRVRVFQEVFRVLQPSGQFLLTDVMLKNDCPLKLQAKTQEIVGLKLASVESYREVAREVGFNTLQIVEMPQQVTRQYQKTLDSLESNFDKLLQCCKRDFLEYQRRRLTNWIEIGKLDYLNWGILHFQKL